MVERRVFSSYPHAQHEWGKVIDVGVHIYKYIYMFVDQMNRTLAIDRNICGRTSRQIYGLALPLLYPEMLSSLSKSRISLFNAHLAVFVRRMTQLRRYRHLVN